MVLGAGGMLHRPFREGLTGGVACQQSPEVREWVTRLWRREICRCRGLAMRMCLEFLKTCRELVWLDRLRAGERSGCLGPGRQP